MQKFPAIAAVDYMAALARDEKRAAQRRRAQFSGAAVSNWLGRWRGRGLRATKMTGKLIVTAELDGAQ